MNLTKEEKEFCKWLVYHYLITSNAESDDPMVEYEDCITLFDMITEYFKNVIVSAQAEDVNAKNDLETKQKAMEEYILDNFSDRLPKRELGWVIDNVRLAFDEV